MFLASRIVSLVAGTGFFLASFLTWFWGEGGGYRRYENAWQGEESLAATICFLIAMGLLGVGWGWRGGWLILGIIELLLLIVCFGLTTFYILHNKEPVIVYGLRYPTGIGVGPGFGLLFSVVMIVGSILNLCSGRMRWQKDEIDEWEDRPLRRRRPRDHDEYDDWDEAPRRRRRPQPRSQRTRRQRD
jgi:hypothetical protein